MAKKYKAQRYYLPKGIIKSNNVIINGKKFNNQPIYSDVKRYEEIRKLTIGRGEDDTTGCLHYKLIADDLRRQKELNADPKAITQIEFVGQLKKLDDNGNCYRYR